MVRHQHITSTVNKSQFGQRLDQVLAKLLPNYSRSRIKTWILDGKVRVNGRITMVPKKKMLGGELIKIDIIIEEAQYWAAQDITLDIIHEDADIIVINKPRDFVVHPGAGNSDGTMLNALLHYYPPIATLPRAGIIHRLDKDTTGLMVVAKTILAQIRLMASLQARKIIREYEAVVRGTMIAGGKVEEPIARHVTKRTCMAVHPMGKAAVTYYDILEHFRAHTRLCLRLETGRSHQIRVHMAHINHPLVGDQLYGRRSQPPKGASAAFKEVLRRFDRQALHASRLRLYHPIRAIEMEWYAPLPQDMVELVDALKVDIAEY